MIDDLVVEMQITPPQEVVREIQATFEYCGVIFQPKFRLGRVTKYYGELKNLMIEIVYDRMFIKNSWHKYYHGNNYGDYTYGEIKETIKLLGERFGRGFFDAKIRKMAIGCNLSMDAGNFFPRCISLGPDIFQDMKFGTNHRIYGKYIKKTHSKFKVYDKQVEVKHHGRPTTIRATLRVELEMKMKSVQDRKTKPIPVYKVMDLFDEFKICYLMEDLLAKIRLLVFDQNLPIEDADSFKDVEIKVFMRDPILRKYVKEKSNPKTYRQWAKRFEELKGLYVKNDDITKLCMLVEDKLVQLLRLDQLV